MQTIADFNLQSVSEDTWVSKLVLLHNVSYLQENLFCSEAKVLGLCGDGKEAEVYGIDPTSASWALEFQVPSWQDLKGLPVKFGGICVGNF
jgi:hypothetical protein